MGGGFFGRLFDRGRKSAPPPRPVATPVRPVATPVRPVATPVGKPVAIPQPMTLGRGEAPTGQRTTIPVHHTLEDAFVAGTMTHVTSSWLAAAQYFRDTRELWVRFLDGFSCRVQSIGEDEARSFYRAPSKGGWYHDHVLGPGWIRGRPGTALKRWH